MPTVSFFEGFSPAHLSYLLALMANLCFATASLVYTAYSRKVSAYWMNAFKAAVSFVALFVSLIFVVGFRETPWLSIALFSLSGFVGLNLGDLFLLSAFVRIGPSRTLMIFAFQPLVLGIAAYWIFGQEISWLRFVSLFFLIACLFLFSLEGYRKEGHWEIRGLVFSLIGVGLDAVGILCSRYAFDFSPQTYPLEGHFYRCLGAVVGFAAMNFLWKPLPLWKTFLPWTFRQKSLLIIASLMGTFLSLLLYLTAVRVGHLASLAGIAVTGPLIATALELLWKREKPSGIFLLAFLCFLIGFALLISL